MAPRKQPSTLFKLCVNKNISIINAAICSIDKKYPEDKIYSSDCDNDVLWLRSYLRTSLPDRLFSVLSSEDTCQSLHSDRFLVLTHPYPKCLHSLGKRPFMDFWLCMLKNFSTITILDLKYICSDEILEVIGLYCFNLEEINIISRAEHNSSITDPISKVTDVGLESVANLKKLKILYMDTPRYNTPNVSKAGVITLLCSLPCLQELRFDKMYYDIGSIIVNANVQIGPLSLQNICYLYPTGDKMRKLLEICPIITDLHFLTTGSAIILDDILNVISISDLKLNKLVLPFLTLSDSYLRFFSVKGFFLTELRIWDRKRLLNYEVLLCIGQYVPNLEKFLLTIEIKPSFKISNQYKKPPLIFSKLEELTISHGLFKIEDILCFFLENTNDLRKLVVKYHDTKNLTTQTKINETLQHLLRKGSFINMHCLWLDRFFEISNGTAMEMVNKCDNLRMLTLNVNQQTMYEINRNIRENNLDLKLETFPFYAEGR